MDEWAVEREIRPSVDRGMVEIHDYGPWNGSDAYRARVFRYQSIADETENIYELPIGQVQANEVMVETQIGDGSTQLEAVDAAFFLAECVVRAVGPVPASELMIARAQNGRTAL